MGIDTVVQEPLPLLLGFQLLVQVRHPVALRADVLVFLASLDGDCLVAMLLEVLLALCELSANLPVPLCLRLNFGDLGLKLLPHHGGLLVELVSNGFLFGLGQSDDLLFGLFLLLMRLLEVTLLVGLIDNSQ